MNKLKELIMRKPRTASAIVVGLIVVIAVVVTLMQRAAAPSRSEGSSSFGLAVLPSAKTPTVAMGAPSMDSAAYGGTVILPPVPAPVGGQTAAEVDQKIIKNGDVSIVVDHVGDAISTLSTRAEANGGFVQNSSVYERADGTQQGSIVLRVPSDAFDKMLAEIQGMARQVKSVTQSGQDVTEQYTDLQAQLRNAQAQEETYLSILKQAKSVEDILKVQQQLGAIRGQIESLQGRIKYLENLTTYSTISVSLEEQPAVHAPTKEFRPLTIATEAFQTVVVVFQQTVVALIWAVIVFGGTLPPLALLIWIIAAVWKRFKRRP